MRIFKPIREYASREDLERLVAKGAARGMTRRHTVRFLIALARCVQANVEYDTCIEICLADPNAALDAAYKTKITMDALEKAGVFERGSVYHGEVEGHA